MPKFLVSIVRDVSRRDVLEVTADSPEEARWIALSNGDAWMGADVGDVSVTSVAAPADRKAPVLRSAA